jgi:hypothetical protein
MNQYEFAVDLTREGRGFRITSYQDSVADFISTTPDAHTRPFVEDLAAVVQTHQKGHKRVKIKVEVWD